MVENNIVKKYHCFPCNKRHKKQSIIQNLEFFLLLHSIRIYLSLEFLFFPPLPSNDRNKIIKDNANPLSDVKLFSSFHS